MKSTIECKGKKFRLDLSRPIDISLPIQNGDINPNCYGADPVIFETIRSGNFIGSVREGGSVNYQKLHITPHGNGTHTECYGHILDDETATIHSCHTEFHFIGRLITISPHVLANGDVVITLQSIQEKITKEKTIDALIIRTLPNHQNKKFQAYSGTNPPYFEKEALEWIANLNIHHLLTDIPSIDREIDGGKLEGHHAFWKTAGTIRKNATITELIYADAVIPDGLYLVNLQIISLEMDASPSKPVLFKITEVL